MQIHEARLQSLREQLKRDGLDGFVVPISDEHMSEYVGAYAQRLTWLTGFKGSAGTAVVLPDQAAIFIDGRYTLQVREQVDANHWSYVSVPNTSVAQWLTAHAETGVRIGYDPWLHTRTWVEQAKRALAAAEAELVAVDSNPVDAVWCDRPEPSKAPLSVHPQVFAGKCALEKRQDIAAWLKRHDADAVILSALDSIAWTFNIRGRDVPRTPVALAYAVVRADATADLYVAREKLTDDVTEHLGSTVRIHHYADFATGQHTLAGKTVVADPVYAVSAIFAALDRAGAIALPLRDPTVLAKALKNEQEIAGQRAAQARDGAAVSKFLHWLSVEAPKGHLTEIDASDRLEAFRRETGLLKDLSFDTISGAGPNGAIVHYKADETSNRRLEANSLYLVDSGGQYRDGTTDITRTVAIGEPSDEMRDRFTRVLKGHIALASTTFPEGTRGGQLDTLARQYLWVAGLDYAHGTGHGVGSFLGVHEGPQSIASAARNDEPLQPGMILSNEPGYYKAGEYGIRIENLVLVETREVQGGENSMLGFEMLTFVPIDRRMIDSAMLSAAERQWIDAYHARVIDIIGPQLDGDTKAWLEAECAPLRDHVD